jgi:hypothetical protein
MVNPVPGFSVATVFGRRGSSWSCQKNSAGKGIHTGVDIPAPDGTTVVAARAGKVRHVTYGGAFGDHQVAVRCADGTEDFYAHMSSRVADGTKVAAGDKVGEVGHEGNVFPKGPAGAHLHFERHKSHGPSWSCGLVVNPKKSLDAGAGQAAPAAGGSGGSVFLSKLRFGQRDSDSVKRLQVALNKHGVPGDRLPVTGNYLEQTDAAVRACQAEHVPPADAAGKSFVGRGQAKHLFAATGHAIVDDLKEGPPPPLVFDYASGVLLPADEVADLLGVTEGAVLDVPPHRLPFTETPRGRRYRIEDVAALLA